MKTVVLLSGGIDSTTCLAKAIDENDKKDVLALFISYGQRHIKEYESAKAIAEYYDVKLLEMDISNIFSFAGCSLLQHSDKEIPEKSYSEQGTVETYVPFRNGTILSVAATIAMSVFPNEKIRIAYGAHRDDAAGDAYPDCSEEFYQSMSNSLYHGSGGLLILSAPFVSYNKKEIVELGLKLKVPYKLTWSCYNGRDKACGVCGTCIDRQEAFIKNKTTDPIEYEVI